MLELGSAAFSQRSMTASQAWQHLFTSSPAMTARSEHRRIVGDVGVVLFDFDGTLTATPGDRSERKYKIAELKERAPMLEPWLRCLRDAGMMLGIISKSSEDTILTALTKAHLRDYFDGPIVAKAVGFDGKAGFIEDLCQCEQGGLSHLGPQGLSRVLLVDDDVGELGQAHERAIQTFPAPQDGGLQYDDFHSMFQALGLQEPPRPADSKDIRRLWSHGMAGESLGMPTFPSQVEYADEVAPQVSDFYEIQDGEVHLGKGAFGVCARGVHLASGQRCAVKLMRKEVVGRHYLETFVEQDLYTFILKMARLESHQNVVRHLDFLMGPTILYCAMELLEGADLDTYLQQNAPITEGFARRIMAQVLQALRHIHGVGGVGLIHRDVKLENLRFRGQGGNSDLVLVDFGLSCSAGPEQKRGIVGTLLYMAPEIFSTNYSTKVDLWSAGVLLYIILTGKPPFKQAQSTGVCPNKQVANGSAVKVALDSEEIANAPPPAMELLKGLMVVDPSQRFSADAALEVAWLSDGTTCVSPVINVDKTTYVSVHEYTLQTPKAKLSLVVSMNESDASPGGVSASPTTEHGERLPLSGLSSLCCPAALPDRRAELDTSALGVL